MSLKVGSSKAEVHTNCFSSSFRLFGLIFEGKRTDDVNEKYAPPLRHSPGFVKYSTHCFYPTPSQ